MHDEQLSQRARIYLSTPPNIATLSRWEGDQLVATGTYSQHVHQCVIVILIFSVKKKDTARTSRSLSRGTIAVSPTPR